ncbi:unnamed protein product, partial [Prunus brigantina]
AQDLLSQGGFWMEGRVNNYNDMEEIMRMLWQLTERIARIEARTQIGKSYDGEGCVNPYLNRVARIDTLSHGSLDGEYEGDSPFHYCALLCESSEEGHATAQDLLSQGGFWMEGRVNNYNDMEEIMRMLWQLTERIARIEARTQIGKSYDGEGCVNPYLNRVARINTLSHGSLYGEYERDSPFHYCALLCESSE